jgi:signal transduction histidine kinase
LVAALAVRELELEREQEAFARLAVQHERARIARELHDIVAHHLAVMVVQAGAGRMAAASGDTSRRAERFAGIRAAGGEALDEMARLLELLEAGRESLPRLLERARAAGLTVRYDGPDELGEDARRIVQEALTNALKHAPGAAVEIEVRGDELSVRDGGARTRLTLAETGAGVGLAGLRERAEAAGGRLAAGPTPTGGWEVRATLPRTSVGAGEDRQ